MEKIFIVQNYTVLYNTEVCLYVKFTKSKVKILQNFVAYSEYMNFNNLSIL